MANKAKTKVLNLYCGIGGNRKLWSDELDITAVEIDPVIAEIYKDFFPHDNVITGDAHTIMLCRVRGKLILSGYNKPNLFLIPKLR